MTNTKSNLISKLGTILLGATGLVGLAGCEAPQGNRNVSPYAQSQPQAYQQQTKEDDGNLEMAILGGVLGVNGNPIVRGVGNGILADSTRPKTNVQVNVNGAQPNAQPQVVYVPVETQKVDERLLPEYDLKQLESEYNEHTGVPGFQGGIYSVFISRDVQDLNGDGIFDFKEFLGIERNPIKGKSIHLNAGFIARNGGMIKNRKPSEYKVSFEVTDEQGKSVFKDEYSGTQDKLWSSRALSLKLPELKPGIYKGNCIFSDKKTTSQKATVFQVLE